MSPTIFLDSESIHQLDISRAGKFIDEFVQTTEIRLWFIRLDAKYPWLPFILDWKSGELARYTAMLVPHQFSRSEGIKYNPESLEIFIMQKIFVIADWLKQNKIKGTNRLKHMAQTINYEIDDKIIESI